MPSPGLYVVAVVVGVAAGIAFKEFVYDPHLAPKIEQWTGAYAAYRSERRRRRASPHFSSKVHSGDEGDDGRSGSEIKSSKELERLVEREMHILGRGSTLRQRKPVVSEPDGLEMMEKPNAFIPFVPLSPSVPPPPLVPNPFATHADAQLPIDRLPTPAGRPESQVADHSSVSEPRLRSSGASSQPHGLFNPSALPPTPPESLSAPAPVIPHTLTSDPVPGPAGPVSENDFTLITSRWEAGTLTPFTNTSASVSRAETPFSETSFADADARSWSSASFPEENPSEASFASHSELEFTMAASHLMIDARSESSLDLEEPSESESSLGTSSRSSIDIRSESGVSIDFVRSDGNEEVVHRRDALLSEDEWERVSEAGRER